MDDSTPAGSGSGSAGDLEQSIKDAVAAGPATLTRNRSSSNECTTQDGSGSGSDDRDPVGRADRVDAQVRF